MRIAYFINQYPKVSHSFIRREILALERQGFVVLRIALRGWNDNLVDDGDIRERELTKYVLKSGIMPLFLAVISTFFLSPILFFKGLARALKMGWRADRPLPYHLVYLAEACRILPWLRDGNIQHVHAHFGTNSTEVIQLVHALGGPNFSFTVHGPEEFDKPQFIGLQEKIRQAAFVVAISSYGRSQLYRWTGFKDWHKVKVVHCGLEPEFHQIQAVLAPSNHRLVCVGRLCEQKGQLLLIEALARLRDKGINIELTLAGDGEMRSEIERLVTHFGLDQQVRITGWISSDQVRDEILAAKAMVLPSFAEGLPVVVMEAMALRRPVLTTYVAGIPELVLPGENGWLFPAGSVEALADAMEVFLQTPDREIQRMGDAAYLRVLQRHNIDAEAAKLGLLFRGCAA